MNRSDITYTGVIPNTSYAMTHSIYALKMDGKKVFCVESEIPTNSGEGKVVQRRINGKPTILSRRYNLYSTIQRADDIVVALPAEVSERRFESEDKIRLINSKITVKDFKIGTRGFTNYIMTADDTVKV